MKKIFLALILFALPLSAGAHGMMMDFGSTDSGFEMMRYIEDQSLGTELHEEMEDLMLKMMSGDLTQEETQRMLSYMDQYPGAYSMMMNRLGGWGGDNMMWGFGWLWMLGWIVWITVGVLLIIWLIKKIIAK